MRENSEPKLSQPINRLRWQLLALAFLLVLADQLAEHTWLVNLPVWGILPASFSFMESAA